MFNPIRGWFYPAPHTGPAVHNPSSHGDTILALALGALSLIAANAFDRSNPGLANVLRCVAGGIGLMWLFNRCHGNGQYTPPPTHHYVAPAPAPNYWRWFWQPQNSYAPGPASRSVRGFPQVIPTPAQPSGFPSVYRAPPQGSPPLYSAPVTRLSGQPVPPPFSSAPQQAHTTYSYATPQATTTYSYTNPHQATTTYSAAPPPGGFPSVRPGGFPTVHQTPAQPASQQMHAAPQTRPGAFPNVQPTSNFGSGAGSNPGNSRLLFPAAVSRG